MNNLENAFAEVSTIGQYSRKYFSYLGKVLESIDENEINKLCGAFEKARENENTIFVAGNGGSSTTATTMANDIGFDIIKKTGTDKPFRVFALTDNSSVITAISNDVGYENIFINQLKIHYRKGDKLIVISASGNSENIVKAAKWVQSQGGKVLGMLGFDGGILREVCDSSVLVPSIQGEYGPVEDMHLMINHLLAHWFQNKLK